MDIIVRDKECEIATEYAAGRVVDRVYRKDGEIRIVLRDGVTLVTDGHLAVDVVTAR